MQVLAELGSGTRRWRRASRRPLPVLVVSLVLVALTARQSGFTVAILPAAVAAVAMVRLARVADRERRLGEYDVERARLMVDLGAWAGAVIASVVVSVIAAQVNAPGWNRAVEAVLFVALGLGLLLASNAVAYVRHLQRLWPRRFAVALGGLTVALALFAVAQPLAPRWLALLAVAVLLVGVLTTEILSEDWTTMAALSPSAALPIAAAVAAGSTVTAAAYLLAGGTVTTGAFAGAVVVAAVVYVAASRWGMRRWPDPAVVELEVGFAGRARIVPVLGAALLCVSAGALWSMGTPLATVAVLLLVLAIAVALCVTERELLMAPLLVVGMLLWAAPSRTEPPVLAATPPSDGGYFVVFGDSYISGEGAQRFQTGTNTRTDSPDNTNQCRRANTAWPLLLAQHGEPGIPSHALFLACSGAVAEQLRFEPRAPEKAAELQLLSGDTAKAFGGPAHRKPAFAVVSIGGNDALFSAIGKTCIGPGDCSEIGDRFLDVVDSALPARLDAAFRDINAALGGDVPVIVVPYPTPIDPRPRRCRGVLLDPSERTFISTFVSRLDDTVAAAAGRAGFSYMDTMVGALTRTDGEGHRYEGRLCGDGAAGINFLAWHPQDGSIWSILSPTNWTHNSLHPNESGHEYLYRAAASWFSDHPVATLPIPTAAPGPASEHFAPVDPGTVTRSWPIEQVYGLLREYLLPVAAAAIGAWLLLVALERYRILRPS